MTNSPHKVDLVTVLAERGPLFGKAVIYIVYATIRRNPRISLNQLRWLLSEHLFVPQSQVDGALSSLCTRGLLDCVARWRSKHGTANGERPVHFEARATPGPAFEDWLSVASSEIEGLTAFEPPAFERAR